MSTDFTIKTQEQTIPFLDFRQYSGYIAGYILEVLP